MMNILQIERAFQNANFTNKWRNLQIVQKYITCPPHKDSTALSTRLFGLHWLVEIMLGNVSARLITSTGRGHYSKSLFVSFSFQIFFWWRSKWVFCLHCLHHDFWKLLGHSHFVWINNFWKLSTQNWNKVIWMYFTWCIFVGLKFPSVQSGAV